MRVFAKPFPGGRDDRDEIRETCRPIEFAADPTHVGKQDRRIAKSSRPKLDGNWVSGHAPCGFDHLANRIAPANADVEERRRSRFQRLQGADVCGAEIIDVDVITNARAVGGCVVRPKQGDVRPLSERDLE